MHDAMVMQQLDVARLEHIVHPQLSAVCQILKSLQGAFLQVCHLRYILVSGGSPHEAVFKVRDQVALKSAGHGSAVNTEQGASQVSG